MLRTSILGAVMAAGVAACATAPAPAVSLTPVGSNGQEFAGVDPETIIESRMPGGFVSVVSDGAYPGIGSGLVIAVYSNADTALPFGPENIRASANGRRLDVYTAEDLEKRLRDDARGYLRATQSTDPLRDISLGTPAATREYRFNNFGGCPAGQGDCQIRGADLGYVYRSDRGDREADAANLQAAVTNMQINQAVIAQRVLKPTLVAPDTMAGGVVVIETPRPGQRIDLTVTFAGQPHQFSFEASPAS